MSLLYRSPRSLAISCCTLNAAKSSVVCSLPLLLLHYTSEPGHAQLSGSTGHNSTWDNKYVVIHYPATRFTRQQSHELLVYMVSSFFLPPTTPPSTPEKEPQAQTPTLGVFFSHGADVSCREHKNPCISPSYQRYPSPPPRIPRSTSRITVANPLLGRYLGILTDSNRVSLHRNQQSLRTHIPTAALGHALRRIARRSLITPVTNSNPNPHARRLLWTRHVYRGNPLILESILTT